MALRDAKQFGREVLAAWRQWRDAADTVDAALAKWIAERPPKVREVAERLRPGTCYRSTTNRGHYFIRSYEQKRNGDVTLCIVHGEDSFLPGIAVFGVDPWTMRHCGCGHWKNYDGSRPVTRPRR